MSMPINMETIINAVQGTIELNAIPKDKIKETLVEAPFV